MSLCFMSYGRYKYMVSTTCSYDVAHHINFSLVKHGKTSYLLSAFQELSNLVLDHIWYTRLRHNLIQDSVL